MVDSPSDLTGLELGAIEPQPEIDKSAVDSFVAAFSQADRERIRAVFVDFLSRLKLNHLPRTRLALKELFYPSKGHYSFKDHSFPLLVPREITTIRDSIARDLVEQNDVHNLPALAMRVRLFLDNLEYLFREVISPRIEYFNQQYHYRSDPVFVEMVGLRKTLERDIKRLKGEFTLPGARFLITAFRSSIQVRMAASKGTGQMQRKITPPYQDRHQN